MVLLERFEIPDRQTISISYTYLCNGVTDAVLAVGYKIFEPPMIAEVELDALATEELKEAV